MKGSFPSFVLCISRVHRTLGLVFGQWDYVVCSKGRVPVLVVELEY